eukprot:7086772-Prymnesium_polylepis.1
MAGFSSMGHVLHMLGIIGRLDGESGMNSQYYGPLITLKNGKFSSTGGGLGGGSKGTGPPDFGGIFIHELGHGFGLPHSGGAYDEGNY